MPRPAKFADPRNRILVRARSLVSKRGFDNVSLRSIAKASDLSPASLYEYFPSKDALFAELAARANQSLHAALSQAATEEDVLAALAAVGRAYVRFALTHTEDFFLLFKRPTSKRRSLADQVPRGSAYQVLLDVMARGIESGELSTNAFGGTENCAYAFWALVHGQATLQLTTLRNFEADFARVDQLALDAFLRALEP